MTDHSDRQYADPDLVKAFISRRGVKTFHVADPDALDSGLSACGRNLAEMIEVGWARGLRRQGLDLCKSCAAGGADIDTVPDEDTESEDE